MSSSTQLCPTETGMHAVDHAYLSHSKDTTLSRQNSKPQHPHRRLRPVFTSDTQLTSEPTFWLQGISHVELPTDPSTVSLVLKYFGHHKQGGLNVLKFTLWSPVSWVPAMSCALSWVSDSLTKIPALTDLFQREITNYQLTMLNVF